jgi:hypothetical protein
MAKRGVIPFFTDNDVADSVGEAILAAGHGLTRLRDHMLSDSPDEIVATNCREHGLVLITHNYKDFRRILRETAAVSRRQANGLSRIELRCKQFRGAARFTAELPLIEEEWRRYQASPKRPMCAEIGDEFVKFSRSWIRQSQP